MTKNTAKVREQVFTLDRDTHGTKIIRNYDGIILHNTVILIRLISSIIGQKSESVLMELNPLMGIIMYGKNCSIEWILKQVICCTD